jgi:hypothetical protein
MAVRARRRILVKRRLRRPYWDGIVRIFDFTGSLDTPTKVLPPDVADRHALWMDWKAIGDDLTTVIGNRVSSRASARRREASLKID